MALENGSCAARPVKFSELVSSKGLNKGDLKLFNIGPSAVFHSCWSAVVCEEGLGS